MLRFITFFIPIMLFSSCTEELDNNLINIETWYWSKSKRIEGTSINIKESKYISFRNNTLIDIVLSNGDTLYYNKLDIDWQTAFYNKVLYTVKGKKYIRELKITDYNSYKLVIDGFSIKGKEYIFKPKGLN